MHCSRFVLGVIFSRFYVFFKSHIMWVSYTNNFFFDKLVCVAAIELILVFLFLFHKFSSSHPPRVKVQKSTMPVWSRRRRTGKWPLNCSSSSNLRWGYIKPGGHIPLLQHSVNWILLWGKGGGGGDGEEEKISATNLLFFWIMRCLYHKIRKDSVDLFFFSFGIIMAPRACILDLSLCLSCNCCTSLIPYMGNLRFIISKLMISYDNKKLKARIRTFVTSLFWIHSYSYIWYDIYQTPCNSVHAECCVHRVERQMIGCTVI